MSQAQTQLTIVPAQVSDIPTLQSLAHRIWHACYPEIISREQITYMLEKMYGTEVIERELASGTIWELAHLGKEPVGYLSYSFDAATSELTLHKIYLLKELQGQGLGQQLLEHVKNRARQRQATAMSLRVNRGNLKAIAAYQRAGCFIAESNVADIGGGFVMDDYIMKWPVAGLLEPGS
jgi:diamine N-acetyltransferase